MDIYLETGQPEQCRKCGEPAEIIGSRQRSGCLQRAVKCPACGYQYILEGEGEDVSEGRRLYKVRVSEMITRDVWYGVWADSAEEALEKAQSGDTEEETLTGAGESVVSRVVLSTPEEIPWAVEGDAG